MDDAKAAIRRTLDGIKALMARDDPPDLSEADTKAHSVERLLPALGWDGVGVVTREYYVRNSQEYIDYALRGPQDRLLLAIETKKLRADLADKHAAQLVQYCAVEGIEWAALTNGRELHLFNTFLKRDLAAKRIMRLDLLAYNTEEEFDTVFDQLWQLSYERMIQPREMATWMHRRRMDATLRAVLTNPGSPLMRHLGEALAEADIPVTARDLAWWFRSNLAASAATARDTGTAWAPASDAATGPAGVEPGEHAQSQGRSERARVADLVAAGLLPVGTSLTLSQRGAVVARAMVDAAGRIVLDGTAYDSPSDRAFAGLLGTRSLNGWTAWRAELPAGQTSLDELRRAFAARGRSTGTGEPLG